MPPANQKSFHLFIYGTLMNADVFRAVLGKRLVHGHTDTDAESVAAQEAVLDGYTKISPDRTYLYAVPDPQGRIRGYIVGPLGEDDMGALRQYEGRNYSRKTVRVHTGDGRRKAVAFVGNLKRMEHSFGYPFRDPLKQEILLREKIDAALMEAEREELNTEEQVSRRAMAELHGDTIRDLVRRHFDAGGISDYAIRSSLKGSQLRDYARIAHDPDAQRLAPHYLRMVIRQVLFNEVEEKVRRDFRYELDHMAQGQAYYERTTSLLLALRMLNSEAALVDTLCADCLEEMSNPGFQKRHLLDYVRWAISAADSYYDPVLARREIALLRAHMGGGSIPLGAELEFSNIGHDVILDPEARTNRDTQYDGFIYFRDFALDALTWKMGGHIDDHHVKLSEHARRGFFETALGSLSLEPSLSKPLTSDPWLLNRVIHEVIQFFPVAPHSLHISLQLRTQHRPGARRLLPIYALKCLFAIGGDPQLDEDGRLVISRLASGEIVRPEPAPNLLFSEISRRHSTDQGDDLASRGPASPGRYVQQFKFLRLSPKLYYEPIVLALKGIQLSFRPGSFLTPEQYRTSPKHRELFETLLAWAKDPQPISEPEIMAFLGHVYDGLITERRGKPAHSMAYITWSLNSLRNALENFNELARQAHGVRHGEREESR